jgi:hypothetical protein
MLRKVLVASLAVAAVSASLLAARPVEAGSCAALSVSIGQAVDQLQKEGRILSLHRGCQGVRPLIQSSLRRPVTQS